MAFKLLVSAVFATLLSAHASPLALKSIERSFPFYSKEEWGAEVPTDVRPLHHPAPYVVIHHTYIPSACDSVEDCSAKMRSMQRYHNSLGWGDIGYHFCVGGDGAAYEGRGWDTVGIHATVANSHSIGICLIGDWRVELPPVEQLETTKALIEEGVIRGKISPDYKLIAHNQVSATECPGDALVAEFSTWPHYTPGRPDFSVLTTTPAATTSA
ncbi:peptidoglycan-recognition protein LB-like [Helicoverpa zea]|nr:peptidoglycan-recognition protein LB-like [Helicoverpa zea]